MLSKNIFDKILGEISKELKHVLEENKPIIICFAGIPCSGKTRLAKKIEEKYKGVRISNDNIRKVLGDFIQEKEKHEKVLREFLINLLKDYPFKNRFIILDSGIERKFDEVKKVADAAGLKMFVIQVIAPKEEILKRIKKKDPERFEKHPEDIKRWFKEYKEFNKNHKSDFVFRTDDDLKELYSEIEKNM